MTGNAQGFPIPLHLLLANAVGAVMIGLGLVGLFAPQMVPALARPAVAYALIGSGLALDIGSVASIVSHLSKARRNRAP
ncbi:MAG: hypothetical protein AB7Q97_19045 [Gammaproteobacteria bacterium]